MQITVNFCSGDCTEHDVLCSLSCEMGASCGWVVVRLGHWEVAAAGSCDKLGDNDGRGNCVLEGCSWFGVWVVILKICHGSHRSVISALGVFRPNHPGIGPTFLHL